MRQTDTRWRKGDEKSRRYRHEERRKPESKMEKKIKQEKIKCVCIFA